MQPQQAPEQPQPADAAAAAAAATTTPREHDGPIGTSPATTNDSSSEAGLQRRRSFINPSFGTTPGSSAPPPILRESVMRTIDPGDWATVDLIHSQEAHARNRSAQHRKVAQSVRRRGHHELQSMLSSGQGLLSAVVAGLVLGVIGIMVEACTRFVVNFRIGICDGFFWLGPSLCCAYRGGAEECESYYTWGEYLGGRDGRHTEMINYIVYVFWTTAFATTAALFCKFYAPYAAGGGIGEVKTIVSGQQVKRYLGPWTMVTKTVGMCFSTGSGLAVGKEGPFVHIGSCVGDLVASIFPTFRVESKRRELITAGAAGGIAVAFGAPIGGVLFSLEDISSIYSYKALLQGLICGVTAVLVVKRVDMFHTGRIVQFSINYQHAWHWIELPAFALLGVIGGLVGVYFNKLNINQIRRRKRLFKDWKITEVVILAFVTGTFNFLIPFCKGAMLELLAEMYQDCTPGSHLEICKEEGATSTMMFLVLAGVMKITMSALTVGSSVPAGLLVPSMCVGGLLGRAFGYFFQAIQQSYSTSTLFSECFGRTQCIVPGAYAIVGSAALLTGVTRMTISLAVIMFELTGGLEYLVPVIVGILMAKWTAEALGVESIFEMLIEENNLPYLDTKKEFHYDYLVSDIYASKSFVTIPSTGMSLRALNDILDKHPFTGFPIVMSETDSTLIGYLMRKDLIKAMQETAIRADRNVTARTLARFRDREPGEEVADAYEQDYTAYVDGSSLQVDPDCSVSRLLYLFKSLGARHVLVSHFSKFAAFISKKDLIAFMRKIEHDNGAH